MRVKLLGELGQLFGREFEFFVNSPAEVIQALVANFGDRLTKYFYDSEEQGVVWRVVTELPEGISSDELMLPAQERCIIAPIPVGKGGGFGRVLLGGALLVGSFFMPATIGVFGATISSFSVGLLGASLILGGIHQMLSPVPKQPKKNDAQRADSFLINTNADTRYQGDAIPVGYGTMMVEDLPIIYLGVDTEDIPIR